MQQHTKENTVNEWLDCMVNDKTLSSAFEPLNYFIDLTPNRKLYRLEYFEKYYLQDDTDTDIKASDGYMIDKIKVAIDEKSTNLSSQESFIDRLIERYYDETETENKIVHEILIAPHSNRYHTNFLFKELVDFCDENELFFEIPNLKTGEFKEYKLIDTDFKKLFYEFCFDNTT